MNSKNFAFWALTLAIMGSILSELGQTGSLIKFIQKRDAKTRGKRARDDCNKTNESNNQRAKDDCIKHYAQENDIKDPENQSRREGCLEKANLGFLKQKGDCDDLMKVIAGDK